MSKEGGALGDRMKLYESTGTQQKLMPMLPAVIRLDGRSFSKYTKVMEKPFSSKFLSVMDSVTKALVEETGAVVGYTQSDEITLVLLQDRFDKQLYFGGKIYKIVSTLSAKASVLFNYYMADLCEKFDDRALGEWTKHIMPTFDARVWNVPNLQEAVNAVLWREQDAIRNSISALAQYHFSHMELYKKSTKDMQEMLEKKDIVWGELPDRLKRGGFFRREKKEMGYSKEERDRLPTNHPGKEDLLFTFERTVTEELNVPRRLCCLSNAPEFLFFGAEPEYKPEAVSKAHAAVTGFWEENNLEGKF